MAIFTDKLTFMYFLYLNALRTYLVFTNTRDVVQLLTEQRSSEALHAAPGNQQGPAGEKRGGNIALAQGKNQKSLDLCNTGKSDKKYGGMREDASVTVQGSKPKFNPSGS